MKKMASYLEHKYFFEKEQILAADDFVNEAYIKIQESIPNRILGDSEQVYSWIFMIMLGQFRNRTRKKSNKEESESRITSTNQPSTSHLDYGNEMEPDIDAHQDCMKEGVKDIKQLEVWKLHSQEGLSRQQMSQQTGVPENTIKNWLVALRLRAKVCLQLITRYRP